MIVEIAPIRSAVGESVAFEGDVPELEVELDQGTLDGPIAVNGMVTNTGEHFLVHLDGRATLQLVCGRCLEAFYSDFTFAVDEEMPYEMVKGAPGHETLDVSRLAQESIFLELPISPVCRADCGGLCPHCGNNRNQKPCTCASEVDNPLAIALERWANNERRGSNGSTKT